MGFPFLFEVQALKLKINPSKIEKLKIMLPKSKIHFFRVLRLVLVKMSQGSLSLLTDCFFHYCACLFQASGG